eukprot:TRINITY_DN10479_c0_g2_i1.p1 TRINITY_DN10479_c0_g2~~TRINITY_DN10479_c0_g2_i1.p1  ORF type:complete len:153 (-),score=31.00 TRINITY_DN10479_c0_g2_i1:87-545(-)
MGSVCCGPELSIPCGGASLTPRPPAEDQVASGLREDDMVEPKEPRAAHRAGQNGTKVAERSKPKLMGAKDMALVMKVVLQLQAHFRRKRAKRKVEEFREHNVVQHWQDPEVMNIDVGNITLERGPNRHREDLPSPRSLAKELQQNSVSAWRR